METLLHGRGAPCVWGLETFLVEWKLVGEFKDRLRGLPLKPS